MKLFLLSTVVGLLLSIAVSAQNVSIPDENFRNYLLANPDINLNQDGEIQLAEAQAFAGPINVNSMTIADLTGIEAFVKATVLNCNWNQLQAVDLSNNTSLREVDLSFNFQLASINFGTNSNLSVINCARAAVSQLDVKGLPALSVFLCGITQLSEIDLSNNPLLYDISLFNCNNLTSVDIRNGNNTAITTFELLQNPNLNCVNVDDVEYAYNNWANRDPGLIFSTDCSQSYDVTFSVTDGLNGITEARVKIMGVYFTTNASGNVTIPGMSVGSYQYSVYAENHISITGTLEVSGMTNQNIILPEGEPSLVYIPDPNFRSYLLGENAINTNADQEVQVAEALAFTGSINIGSMGISDLTGIEAFANLKVLDCNYNNITDLDLSNNQALESLSCIYNQIEFLTLGTNPVFNHCLCYSNKISYFDVSGCPALRELRCGTNRLKSIDFRNNPNLEIVDVRENKLQKLDVRNGNNAAITFFYIPDNPDLKCVSVDDPVYSAANWASVDQGLEFSNDCFPYTITFSVFSGVTPISGATVTTTNIYEVAENTNASGQAIIQGVGNGEYIYRVEAPGYKAIVGYVNVDDANAAVNVQLTAGVTDIVNIPDLAFKNLLVNDPNINLNSDTEIQSSEAQYYNGNIDAENLSIQALTGIEWFINITGLYCQWNNFVSVDLSNNSKLSEVDFSFNPQLANLNLGANDFLSYLNCSQTALSQIDVSDAPALMHFLFGVTSLSEIDLSNNPLLYNVSLFSCANLTSVDVRNGNNQGIKYFDLASNPNLQCVNVDNVEYAYSNWTSRDPGVVFSTECTQSYDVTFSVTDGTNGIAGAHVKLDGIYYTTDNTGIVTIPGVGRGIHEYSVVAENHSSITGTLDVSGPATQNVVLLPGEPSFIYIPDFNFRSYLLGESSINTNGDGEIQVSEAVAVSGKLNVSSMNIKDLTGIGYFTSITSLDCSYNNIPSIDLSNLVNLEGLDCIYSSIQAIEFGSISNLASIICYANKISTLPVAQFPDLVNLRCDMNPSLTELDLRNNPKIEIISCSECNLNRLDLRNGNNTAVTYYSSLDNSGLACISVDNMEYSTANWTFIDPTCVFSKNCGGSDDASLSSILVDGIALPGFQSSNFDYVIDFGSERTEIPVISALASNSEALVTIDQPTAVDGIATIHVISGNGLVNNTYQVDFNLLVNAKALSEGFYIIYPNPVDDILEVKGINNPEEISIFNSNAQLIRCFIPTGAVISTGDLKSGTYYLCIKDSSRITTLRFVKR